MNRIGLGKRWLAGVVLAAGGCGALPDFLLDAGREAAKEALEKSVEEAVEQVVNGVVDDLWNSNDMSRLLEADDEGGRDVHRER